jgi:hypothetical protein
LCALVAAAVVAGPNVARGQTTPSLIGAWQQSGWKLCKPAAQLSARDADPPIENLVFQPDGIFTIMWQGGGAHTTDIPHVFVPVPDYRGHYTIDQRSRSIRMRADNGLFVPRDFSGDGTYMISGNTLTLTGVWFGTKQAQQKPDICELTFTRK